MELSTVAAARQLGVSQRQVQRLAAERRVASRSVAGRVVIGGNSLLAASRTGGRGRRWDAHTAAAAAEMLEDAGPRHGTQRITGRERSRLRARLATLEVSELAYHVLGNRVSVWRRTGGQGSAAASDGLSSMGSFLDVKVTARSAELARRLRLLEDPDGDTAIVELDTTAVQTVSDLVLYAYGDVRTSSAARARIEKGLAQFR